MPYISEKQREMHDLLAISIANMKEGLEEDYRKHHGALVNGQTPANIAEDFQGALDWYDRMLETLHGIIMGDSTRSRIEELTRRVAILERSVRKLEGKNW